ncbi:hypothetical protein BGW39_003180 [Mortierella sp. 14UC]|nr:hypothetical protein BGW39_003180 [Mortierella sp. 14UC]
MAEHRSKFVEIQIESGYLGSVDTRDEPSSSIPYEGRWAVIRHKLRKAAAEFVGTTILMTLGLGAIAQLALTPERSSWGAMAATWGLSLTLAIYGSGGISGAALNPAVTLAMALFRGFSWVDVPLYWAAQTAGAFAAALIIFILNEPAIHALNKPEHTIGIFITGLQTTTAFPNTSLNETTTVLHAGVQLQTSTTTAFFAEFLGTALLMFVILATSQSRGITPTDPKVQPMVIGVALTAIGMGLGVQTGFALNPARDFGPRMFVAVAGWGVKAFSRQGYYFWVPIIAPFLGAIGGALTHDILAHTSKQGAPSRL